VRSAVRGDHQECCPGPSSPPSCRVGDRHASELAAVDVANPVVPGQALVDEGVVRRHQVDDVAVLAHDALEQQFGLALERPAEGCRRSRGTSASWAAGSLRFRRYNHWLAKFCTSAPDLRVGQHPSDLVGRAPPDMQPPLSRRAKQRLVRDAAPQEEGQARRQFQIADAVDRPGATPSGSRSARNTNSGSVRMRCRATSMPSSKPGPGVRCDRTRGSGSRSAAVTGRR
jgi:hypothetical protein